jgi:hypothetical protein
MDIRVVLEQRPYDIRMSLQVHGQGCKMQESRRLHPGRSHLHQAREGPEQLKHVRLPTHNATGSDRRCLERLHLRRA